MRKHDSKDYLIVNSILNEKTGCWEWSKALDSKGYGRISRNGNDSRLAHRLSYTVFIGTIPDKLCVCHKCDNPKCINPDHLFVGTNKDNMHDMATKGRSGNGSLSGEDSWWYGKKHKQESKNRIGIANSKYQKGKGNSQYGTCWIYNLKFKENKKIPRFELKKWKDEGWIVGRKMKF